MVDWQKAEVIVRKWQRDEKRNSLSIEDNKYYDSETSVNSDPNNNFNLLGDDWNEKLSWTPDKLIESSIINAQWVSLVIHCWYPVN